MCGDCRRAIAPWDISISPLNESAEQVVRQWLDGDWPVDHSGVRCDDEHITDTPLQFRVSETTFSTLHSCGATAAFHALQSGHDDGGFEKVAGSDQPAQLHCINYQSL